MESDVGRGTTFKVYLPRTNELEAEVRSAPADALALRGQETILLVEDEELVRNYVYRILTRRGYQVHAIAHPRRAIEYAGAHSGAIDLVFSDVVLPDMSGKAMVEELQRWHPESKVLYMSGYADDAKTRGCRSSTSRSVPMPWRPRSGTCSIRAASRVDQSSREKQKPSPCSQHDDPGSCRSRRSRFTPCHWAGPAIIALPNRSLSVSSRRPIAE